MRYRDGSLISYDSGDYAACLDKAMELADYAGFEARRKAALAEGLHLGIGIAAYIEDTGVGPYEGATVRVQRSGKILVETGAASQGQGHATVLAQICADELGVDIEDVTVVSADTGRFPMGIGTIGSRIAVVAGSSVHQAAREVREKALKLAAETLEVSTGDLEIIDGAVKVKGADVKVTLAELANRLISSPGAPLPKDFSPGLEATAYFTPGSSVPHANGTNIAEVSVDAGTGEVKILRYSVGHDCGRLINPGLVDGQIVGGVVHGIGNALFERMSYDANGQPLTMNYGEYLLPLATEVPHIEVAHIETPSPLNPLGVKGAGEGGTIPAAAAIIAAVENALRQFDIRVNQHPVSPDWIAAQFERGQTLSRDHT
jgi:carbon-monoxide dehydrogenase large subunit